MRTVRSIVLGTLAVLSADAALAAPDAGGKAPDGEPALSAIWFSVGLGGAGIPARPTLGGVSVFGSVTGQRGPFLASVRALHVREFIVLFGGPPESAQEVAAIVGVATPARRRLQAAAGFGVASRSRGGRAPAVEAQVSVRPGDHWRLAVTGHQSSFGGTTLEGAALCLQFGSFTDLRGGVS